MLYLALEYVDQASGSQIELDWQTNPMVFLKAFCNFFLFIYLSAFD